MKSLYTKLKIFHYQSKLDSLPAENPTILPPIHIRIKPTNACNHNCWYCAYRVDNLQLGKDMNIRDFIPREKMLEIIDDLEEMNVQAVTFSGGGEPFCYPHLLDTVKMLHKKGIKFASLTNGARLQGELGEFFAYHAVWVRISIDGWDDESYAGYRGCQVGEFSKLMENLRVFSQIGGNCYLGVSIIVDGKNGPHLFDFIGRLKDLGVNSVKISPCVVSNSGADNNRYHSPFFHQVREQIQKSLAIYAGPQFEIFDAYHELDETFDKDYSWCPYLQILPVIGADQNIYPCQDKAYNLEEGLIGSIKQQRFKDFWLQGKEKFFQVNPQKVCNHHCVANAKNKMVLEYLNAHPDHLSFV
jgi:MoaA/NifB/PqqE/SkfB family radical SAM enzyme